MLQVTVRQVHNWMPGRKPIVRIDWNEGGKHFYHVGRIGPLSETAREVAARGLDPKITIRYKGVNREVVGWKENQ